MPVSFKIKLGQTVELDKLYPDYQEVDPLDELTPFERGFLEFCRDRNCEILIYLDETDPWTIELRQDLSRIFFELPEEIAALKSGRKMSFDLPEINTRFFFVPDIDRGVCLCTNSYDNDVINEFYLGDVISEFQRLLQEICSRAVSERFIERDDANEFLGNTG